MGARCALDRPEKPGFLGLVSRGARRAAALGSRCSRRPSERNSRRPMKTTAIEDVLAQLRVAAARSAVQPAAAQATGPDFGATLKAALDAVHGTQQRAAALGKAYALGEPGVELHDFVLAIQKANIALHGAIQVRNKLVAAYHEIMNMQV
jgi:flagellar hook-basal body complex protein FliE